MPKCFLSAEVKTNGFIGTWMVPPILTLNRKNKQNVTVLFSDHPKHNRKIWLLELSGGWGWGVRGGFGVRLQLDAAKKSVHLNTKCNNAIMLLHIHKFLLRAYHSMQSTLPCHHRSRGGGGITATVGGENSEFVSG